MSILAKLSDDQLIDAMLGVDRVIAIVAKRTYDARHANDPKVEEPSHCDECFEGCQKCQGTKA